MLPSDGSNGNYRKTLCHVHGSILTANRVVRHDANATVELRVAVPELVIAGAELPVTVTTVAVASVSRPGAGQWSVTAAR